jgi:hypothetical protein
MESAPGHGEEAEKSPVTDDPSRTIDPQGHAIPVNDE